MSQNLDNLLVEAFSKTLFKGVDEDNGRQDKEEVEEGEIDTGDDTKHRHKKTKSKHKTKHSLKTLKTKARIESKVRLKSGSKSGLKSGLETKIGIKSGLKRGLKSKTKLKCNSKLKSKTSCHSKTKRSKSSDKSVKSEDKKSDDNESEVMKLLLSKNLKSYAQIEFKDDPKDTAEEEMSKKSSKHKSSKKESQKRKKHKKSKDLDKEYEIQRNSYYSTKSSTTHEDYFYGSYYEGVDERPQRGSRSHSYSRPMSPLYETDWRSGDRSRSPIDYQNSDRRSASPTNSSYDRYSGHRRRSLSPIDRSSDRYSRQRSLTPFYKGRGGYSSSARTRRSLTPSNRHRDHSLGRHSVEPTDRIDKQKLLEIAKINLIKMIEKGDLPKGTDINKLKLRHLRELTTQKSVQQWTEFCRAISALESVVASDSDLDSDYDSDNSDMRSVASEQHIFSIRHPFKLKERKDIAIRVRSFNQLPIRSAQEMAKELREQFPVSSGNQHRIKEIEWKEVADPMPPPLLLPKKAKKIENKLTTPSAPVQPTDEEMRAFTIKPTAEITTPAVAPIPTPSPIFPIIPIPLESTSTETTSTEATSDSTQPMTTTATESEPKTDSVFPPSSMAIDIGSVMAQRLSAMRKLQADPHNVVALKQMFQSNQMMTEWAESKIVPGQFIGSTGATVLTPNQLEGNFNAWTRKDQLRTAAPITDGIGMLLLLKMGWSPGQGLGKNNEGVVDPIVLDIKMDKKGLVAEQEEVRNLPLQLVSTGNARHLGNSGKNPVSILHELSARKRWQTPTYELVSEVGPDHRKNFTFKVLVNGVEYQPSVSSANKKQAKALAAGVCLQAFGLLPKDQT